MRGMKVRGVVLPEGESREFFVVDGQITSEKPSSFDSISGGWIVPGLVDAHCHLGLDDFGATSPEETEQQAVDDRDGGALLIRDAGSAADTRWIQDRDDLPRLKVPSLVLQCSDDIIAPNAVGEYVHRNTPGSTLKLMQATGHCPHMSAPEETIALMREYLETSRLA